MALYQQVQGYVSFVTEALLDRGAAQCRIKDPAAESAHEKCRERPAYTFTQVLEFGVNVNAFQASSAASASRLSSTNRCR